MTTIVDLDRIPFAYPGQAPATGWQLGLIGGPAIAHSISPPMQGAGLQAIGVTGTYHRWQTEPDGLPGRVATVRADGILGANVTVPHKEAVVVHLDGITPLAARVGAVNTIVRRDNQLIGDNTDVAGFAAGLLAQTGSLAGQTVVVLGAGGAARAVLIALERLDAGRIVVANRTTSRATDLISDLDLQTAAAIGLESGPLADALSGARVLVNATALGWQAGETPIDHALLTLLPDDAHVTDLTYRDTDLLIAARTRGFSTSDGLEMLIGQGAEALRRWTGQQPPVEVMRAAAIAARA